LIDGCHPLSPSWQIRSLRSKVVRLVSLVEMKYKSVSFEVLHSKKEKVRAQHVCARVHACGCGEAR
jgi:hypothetical protein